jgi:hypothetical protein
MTLLSWVVFVFGTLTVLHILLHFKFQSLYHHCSRSSASSVENFVSSLRPGDVVFLCAKRNSLLDAFELFLRPILHGVFQTCYIHPVYIGQDKDNVLKILHWTGSSNYHADQQFLCPSKKGPNVSTGDVTSFFNSHALKHGPVTSYRVYRPANPIDVPFETVVQKSLEVCNTPVGIGRNQMQCFFFLLKLLQYIGYIDPATDVYNFAYPRTAEKLLLRNGFYMHQQYVVCRE